MSQLVCLAYKSGACCWFGRFAHGLMPYNCKSSSVAYTTETYAMQAKTDAASCVVSDQNFLVLHANIYCIEFQDLMKSAKSYLVQYQWCCAAPVTWLMDPEMYCLE